MGVFHFGRRGTPCGCPGRAQGPPLPTRLTWRSVAKALRPWCVSVRSITWLAIGSWKVRLNRFSHVEALSISHAKRA